MFEKCLLVLDLLVRVYNLLVLSEHWIVKRKNKNLLKF